MKRIVTVAAILLLCWSAKAQFSVSSAGSYVELTTITDLDRLFLFNGIQLSTEITYTGSYTTSVEWREFDNSFVANTPNMSPDDNTGYILLVDNVATYYIWTIDYSLYPITFNSLTPFVGGDDICTSLAIDVQMTAPDLVYYDKNGIRHTLPRAFTLHYTDIVFSSDAWSESPQTATQSAPFTSFIVDAPKQNTHFTLSGDDWARQLGLTPDSIAVDYYAVAVEMHMKGTVEERTGINEVDRSSSIAISGSGPLIVAFESRANTPTASFFEWFIYNIDTPNQTLRYTDENPRYTFQEYGRYRARLIVTNDGGCVTTDSLDINVLASSLDIPNVFTPNGDGINDEFRVAFRSLKTFRMKVVNRWGRVVYESTDPTKGWDGRINGKNATVGTYYYIIEAVGVDKDDKGKDIVFKRTGDINLLRNN